MDVAVILFCSLVAVAIVRRGRTPFLMVAPFIVVAVLVAVCFALVYGVLAGIYLTLSSTARVVAKAFWGRGPRF
jgi:hypothetical protein